MTPAPWSGCRISPPGRHPLLLAVLELEPAIRALPPRARAAALERHRPQLEHAHGAAGADCVLFAVAQRLAMDAETRSRRRNQAAIRATWSRKRGQPLDAATAADLERLAARIRALHDARRRDRAHGAAPAAEAGALLARARILLPPGAGLGRWARRAAGIGPRTARDYLRLHRLARTRQAVAVRRFLAGPLHAALDALRRTEGA